MTDELLDELINKHNFVVRVTTDEDDPLCVMIDFAGKKHAYYRVVADEEGDIYGISYWSDLMGDSEEFLPLQICAIRTYILSDIYRQCRWMQLPLEIVRFYSSKGEKVEFIDLLSLEMDEPTLEAEKVLEEVLTTILNGEANLPALADALEKDGLMNTFNVLRATLI